MDSKEIIDLKALLVRSILTSNNKEKLQNAYQILKNNETNYKVSNSLKLEMELALIQMAEGETISWDSIKKDSCESRIL